MSEDRPLTLDDYNKRIIRPMILNGIRSGRFDILLKNARERDNLFQVYSSDLSIIFAIVDRLRELGFMGDNQ